MGQQLKPDAPTIIKMIIKEAYLPESKSDSLQKLNRHQLSDLHTFVVAVKNTNKSLTEKITTLIEKINSMLDAKDDTPDDKSN